MKVIPFAPAAVVSDLELSTRRISNDRVRVFKLVTSGKGIHFKCGGQLRIEADFYRCGRCYKQVTNLSEVA